MEGEVKHEVIKGGFAVFRKECIVEGAIDQQVEAMEIAFFAGVQFFFTKAFKEHPGTAGVAGRVQMISSVSEELNAFIEKMRAQGEGGAV